MNNYRNHYGIDLTPKYVVFSFSQEQLNFIVKTMIEKIFGVNVTVNIHRDKYITHMPSISIKRNDLSDEAIANIDAEFEGDSLDGDDDFTKNVMKYIFDHAKVNFYIIDSGIDESIFNITVNVDATNLNS